MLLNIEIYMFICSPQRSGSCQTPSCHHPTPPPMTCSQLWLWALALMKQFKIQIPLFSWLWSWAHWAVFEIGCLPARHPYSPKLILLHLMGKLVVTPPSLSEACCVIYNATKAWQGWSCSVCLAAHPVPPPHNVVRGLSCLGTSSAAVVGRFGEEGHQKRQRLFGWNPAIRFTRHFPDKELTVGGGNRQLGRWQCFFHSPVTLVQLGTDTSLM